MGVLDYCLRKPGFIYRPSNCREKSLNTSLRILSLRVETRLRHTHEPIIGFPLDCDTQPQVRFPGEEGSSLSKLAVKNQGKQK